MSSRSRATWIDFRNIVIVMLGLSSLFLVDVSRAQSCQKSTECPGVMVCDAGQCRAAGSARPVPAYCSSDAQCGPGKKCESGNCVVVEPSHTRAPSVPPPGQLTPSPPAASTPPPGQLSPNPSTKADTAAPSPSPPPSSGSSELLALKEQRERVALVAPILLMSIGAVAAAQGVAFIVINDNSSIPSEGLKAVGIVFVAGGATALVAGAALLPVRISKRQRLDEKIRALEGQNAEPAVSLTPLFTPRTASTPGFFGAAVRGTF